VIRYDPRRLQGVTVYREADRAFARDDRVQATAPDRGRDVANRELGNVERIDRTGRTEVRFDSGRTASFEPRERLHLDYGYAVTSHSSQGQTADRVLVHVETERASEQLVNRRLAYVAVSRGRPTCRSLPMTRQSSPAALTATWRIVRHWSEARYRFAHTGCRPTGGTE
jgi:ATP-dependent exoDNAse (exonuclease V) alpha subunit